MRACGSRDPRAASARSNGLARHRATLASRAQCCRARLAVRSLRCRAIFVAVRSSRLRSLAMVPGSAAIAGASFRAATSGSDHVGRGEARTRGGTTCAGPCRPLRALHAAVSEPKSRRPRRPARGLSFSLGTRGARAVPHGLRPADRACRTRPRAHGQIAREVVHDPERRVATGIRVQRGCKPASTIGTRRPPLGSARLRNSSDGLAPRAARWHTTCLSRGCDSPLPLLGSWFRTLPPAPRTISSLLTPRTP